MADWNLENAAHLLRRAAFGGTPEQIRDFFDRHDSVAEAVEELVNFKRSKSRPPKGGDDFYWGVRKQQTWWLKRMLKAKRPGDGLRENLVLFWHNHLACGHNKQPTTAYMAAQNRLFRIFARGNFKQLMREFNRDGANLYYLDGILNEASQDGIHVNVNENFGRELMELFTLGVKEIQADGRDDPLLPTYTEADVHNLARACTGWVEVDKKGVGEWLQEYWDGGQYDDDGDDLPDPMTIFGVTRNDFRIDESVDGLDNDVLTLIFDRTDTAGNSQVGMFLARKFWTWFAYPAPATDLPLPYGDIYNLYAEFAGVFEQSGWEVTDLLRAMFNHDEFYSDRAKSRTIRNPVDFAIQSLRAFRIKGSAKHVGDHWELMADQITNMGMELFEPPNVAGWPGGERWVTTGTLLSRADFARILADADGGSMRLRLREIENLPLGNGSADPGAVVDALLAQLGLDVGPAQVSAAQRQIMIDFATDNGASPTLDLSHEYTDDAYEKVRGLVALLLQSPEYQII